MASVISILVAIMSALLTFYLANRLTLNDSMDSKSGWRKELMNIASKDEITLADIYRIRASVRYYPHLKPTQLSFRWMTNLIIKLCDEYLVEAYRNKKADNTNNMQNVKKVQLTKSKNKRFSRQIILGKFKFNKSKRLSSTCSTNYGTSQNNLTSVIALPETDEIVRIICRYLLKYHWEARQKMRIFRRGRDLMNIDDDKPSEDAVRTIQLILEQVKEMDNNQSSNDNIQKNIETITETIAKTMDNKLKKDKDYENKSKCFKTIVYSTLILSFSALIFNIAYKVLTLKSTDGSNEFEFDTKIIGFKDLFIGSLHPIFITFVEVIGILLICCLLYGICYLLKKCCSYLKK